MRFRAIADRFTTVDQVQEALRKGGLESSNLIVAVDFTKSNEWTGKRSFGGKSLHAIGDVPSPYEEAIGVIGRTLAAFDDDGLIPCYGFGDATTGDRGVFSFLANDTPCQGLDQVLWRYRELCPYVRMAGPTSFAPAIRQAARIVERSGNQYHILLLVADGQVSRSSDLPSHQHSSQEQDTIDAIVEASHLPLSIVMVGVGDGPWDLMKDFDDALPQREFDNFQFVNFTDVVSQTPGSGDAARQRREALFALRALMEVPEQYQAIQRLGLLGAGHSSASARQVRSARQARTLPPLDPPVPPAIAYGSAGAGLPPRGQQAPAASYPVAAGPTGGSKEAGCSGATAGKTSASGAGDSAAQPAGGAGPSAGGAGLAPAASGPTPDPMFLCPITHDVMADPVIATDGYSYDRTAITTWLARHETSPLTNARMPGATLIPNHALRSAIMEWKQRNGLS
ncbi:hypothetical protein GPECTOR_52g24 [Gonium pectorale]|uniref:U-box domain-containing protein n=1 Tax=Gonium pectorale TaxID=33097 RepID=A0A150G6Z6_GONPE|nr:hypothetical protein GPECTOR_52g24 [Gonium pectorale]|eukprot:KXZ45622.1 hypothetical protein GPECTOR_52g24 [Gonium pectorale]